MVEGISEEQAGIELLRIKKKMELFQKELNEIENIEDENERFVKLFEIIDKIKNIDPTAGETDEES